MDGILDFGMGILTPMDRMDRILDLGMGAGVDAVAPEWGMDSGVRRNDGRGVE